jgi:hypothetical protein
MLKDVAYYKVGVVAVNLKKSQDSLQGDFRPFSAKKIGVFPQIPIL